jgi:hypothetical protein
MKLKDSKLFKTYIHLINERESIRVLKESGSPKPWTKDPHLSKWRFTNMRRMDDKVSLWLLHNWYEPYFDHPNMLYAALVARFFNHPKALNDITHLVFSDKGWPKEEMCALLRKRKARKVTIFNNAYMVRGNDGVDKVDTVMNFTLDPIVKNPPKVDTNSLESTWKNLVCRYGMGSFMAGQVVADLRWAMTGDWSDCNFWAPVGPGSSRGICRLYKQPKNKMIDQKVFLPKLTYLREISGPLINQNLNARMEMMDWQNSLCEFDKYMRLVTKTGRPKQRYKGT